MKTRSRAKSLRADINRRNRRRAKPKKKGPYDDLKMEVARELGLMSKVRRKGWAELTAAESGRIGGIMTRRLRDLGLVPKPSRADSETSPPQHKD